MGRLLGHQRRVIPTDKSDAHPGGGSTCFGVRADAINSFACFSTSALVAADAADFGSRAGENAQVFFCFAISAPNVTRRQVDPCFDYFVEWRFAVGRSSKYACWDGESTRRLVVLTVEFGYRHRVRAAAVASWRELLRLRHDTAEEGQGQRTGRASTSRRSCGKPLATD